MCLSGIVYAAGVSGRRLTFEAEAVWRRNMIMRDRETRTLWQHATGKALAGPLAGSQLELLPSHRTQWGAWSQEHSDSLVTTRTGEWTGLFSEAQTRGLLENATGRRPVPGLTSRDPTLPWDEPVLGLAVEGAACAYPRRVLEGGAAFEDQLADQRVLLVRPTDGEDVRAFLLPAQGHTPLEVQGLTLGSGSSRWDLRGQPLTPATPALKPLPVQRTNWAGWREFNPILGSTRRAVEATMSLVRPSFVPVPGAVVRGTRLTPGRVAG